MSEHRVGQASKFLKNGEMKRLDLEGTGVIIARVNDEYFACGGNCSHYGAPLEEGVLKGHNLMCPWHHACFDVRNGARLEPPALNDIAHFPLRIEKDEIIVTLPQDNEGEPQGKADSSDQRTFVIVGGGSAGNAAVEELRRSGYRGKIIMISAVPNVPVDRPNLSKDYLAGKADPGWIPLRGDESWYAARDIELRLNTQVTKIDPKAHQITLDKGGTLRYDKLLLATGGTPRQLRDTPGTDLNGVFTLRVLSDADKLIEVAGKSKRAVMIGASFIAMEAAASFGERGISVTVVGIEALPFDRILGPEIGKMFQEMHEKHGVQFRLNAQVKQITGKDGHVTGVELKSGETLPADFVLIGVGVRPATDFLADSELKLEDKDKSVRVNANLQTNDPDVYAAGDIARWDDGSPAGQRIEHWRVAEQQGVVAAHNMLGKKEDANQHVPFFWTHQWDIEMRYVGHAEKWDEIIYRGSPDQQNFVAFFVAGGRLLAAATCNHDQEADAIEFILRDRMPLSPTQMRDSSFDLVAYARNSG